MNTVLVKDELETFIPRSHEINYVILGTMASSCARTIAGIVPENVFYYHNGRNQCWKILSHIFHGESRLIKEVTDRQNFLEHFGIAMANIVASAEVPEVDSSNSADSVLFNAHKLKKLKLKIISDEFKNILQSRPVFFTCKNKMELTYILEEYFSLNGLDKKLVHKINYLPSPTRCSVDERSRSWVNMGLIKVL